MDIEYDAKLDPAVERELLDRLVGGRDWNMPFRKPARLLQVMFNNLEMLAEPVLVYARADTIDPALARVQAIAPGPEAGRALRDPVHDAIELVAEDLARLNRTLLNELLAGVDLATLTLMPRSVLDAPESRWAVDCRETHLRDLVVYLGDNRFADGLFVLHPERKRPLRALRLHTPDPAALPFSDIEGWLSQRAPQIHRIG
jgi:hypothetical protein